MNFLLLLYSFFTLQEELSVIGGQLNWPNSCAPHFVNTLHPLLVSSCSVVCSLSRLVLSSVGNHALLDSLNDILHAVLCAVPVEDSGDVDVACTINARKGDLLASKLDGGGLNGIVVTASNVHLEEAVLELAHAGTAENGGVPGGKGLIVGIIKTKRDHGITDTVLSSLQFLVQLECSRF